MGSERVVATGKISVEKGRYSFLEGGLQKLLLSRTGQKGWRGF